MGNVADAADAADTRDTGVPPTQATRATRVALLGTIGRPRAEALRHDVERLRALIESLEPDLLGVEVEPDEWERGRLDAAPLEVRAALVPAARRTDTVVVPLGAPSPDGPTPPAGGPLAATRGALVRAADALLAALQGAVGGLDGVNGTLFRHLCHPLCALEAAAAGEAGRRAWESGNERILERLLWAVRRDPGRRVLVAVQCRRVAWLEARLRALRGELEVVHYQLLCDAERGVGPDPAGPTPAAQRA